MKYFVLEAAIVNYGQLANAVTVKDSYNEARMLFHQVRASQLANTEVTYGSCAIIDEQGRVYENEFNGSTSAQPEPGPEPEPSEGE